MFIYNICGYFVLLLLSLLVALVSVALLRRHLYDLVKEVVKLPSAAVFYVRAFAITVIYLSLANVIRSSFDFKQTPRFMEYVLAIAGNLDEVFRHISLALLGYLLLVTIVVVVLKRRHE